MFVRERDASLSRVAGLVDAKSPASPVGRHGNSSARPGVGTLDTRRRRRRRPNPKGRRARRAAPRGNHGPLRSRFTPPIDTDFPAGHPVESASLQILDGDTPGATTSSFDHESRHSPRLMDSRISFARTLDVARGSWKDPRSTAIHAIGLTLLIVETAPTEISRRDQHIFLHFYRRLDPYFNALAKCVRPDTEVYK